MQTVAGVGVATAGGVDVWRCGLSMLERENHCPLAGGRGLSHSSHMVVRAHPVDMLIQLIRQRRQRFPKQTLFFACDPREGSHAMVRVTCGHCPRERHDLSRSDGH